MGLQRGHSGRNGLNTANNDRRRHDLQGRSDLELHGAGRGRPLRVLHVITHLALGGAEGVAMGLIKTLRPQVDSAVFVVLRHADPGALGREMMARFEADGIPYAFGVGGQFKKGGVVLAALALVRTLKAVNPDVVHLHTEIPELTFAVACALSAHARRVPLLRTVHNCVLWIAWPQIGRWVTERLAHGEAIAVSHAAADADHAIRTRRARPRAAVIYNGVARPMPAPELPRSNTFRLLFAGRFVDQKGADLLPAILAIAYSQTERRDVEVTIAGTGILRDAIMHELTGKLSGWNVQIVEPIARLADRLHDFDGVLAPSRFEGFGLLPVEALLAGVPVVTTDAPGLVETVPASYPLRTEVGDVNGLGALVALMIRQPAKFRAIAERYAIELAERFDPATMAAAYATRYHALARRAA